MRLRDLRLLLAAWCGLVIAPAVVATMIAMGRGSEDVGGAVVLTWVIGYLVQFGVFLVISRQTSGTNIKRTLRLRIERSDGVPPYEAKYRGTFMFGEIPSVGSTLALRVDPDRPNHFEVSCDGGAAPYDDEPVTTLGSDIAHQLREVAELHLQGRSPMASSPGPSVAFPAAEPRSGRVGEFAQRALLVGQLLSRDGGP